MNILRQRISLRRILGMIEGVVIILTIIHISEPTRPYKTSYAVFCLKKKTTPTL